MDPNQENQGEGSAGDNRQAIFTPQPEVTSTTETPTQPSVDLSHPYFSNHPTQTFNTDVGDIILNTGAPKPKQNKRPFIIGGIILGCFVVVCVAALIISNVFVNNDKQVLSLLRNNYESANWIENFFADAYYNKLTVNDIFTAETHEKLNSNMSKLENLQKSLAKIKSASLSSSAQQDFALLQNRLNERTPSYKSSVALYNSLYEAYTNNTPDILKDLLTSENYYVNLVAERFYNYLSDQEKLWAEIIDSGCDYNNRPEACQYILEEYLDAKAILGSNTSITAAIFEAYYDGSYAYENLFMPRIDVLLEEIK